MNRGMRYVLNILMLLIAMCAVVVGNIVVGSNVAYAARLKDIADIEGVRGNDLIGYGLVVGLQGTGDKSGTLFTSQSMSNMLERLGVRVNPNDLKLANVAAVMVTGSLPPFARPGSKIDVTLSSVGDCESLQGGILVMTPLYGADGKVYAVSQGSVSIGGFVIEDGGDTTQKNHPTVGRIAKGAVVERAISFDLFASGQIRIVLREPDFITVTRVQTAVNVLLGEERAKAIDSTSVVLQLSNSMVSQSSGTSKTGAQSPVELIAKLETLAVEPDVAARVVVNERTGTVIMGKNVHISTVAIAHGNLNITIKTQQEVSQPNALAQGETTTIENTEVGVTEDNTGLSVIPESVTLGQVVDGLNALGATPRDLIAILQALQKAGALQAELVVM